MSKKGGNPQNLRQLTTNEAREIGAEGGRKSGEVRRQKKLMSMIYAEYLQKEHNVIIKDGNGNILDQSKMSAHEIMDRTMTAILTKGDSSTVSLMKEIREGTEGSKIKLSGDSDHPVEFKIVDPPCRSRES